VVIYHFTDCLAWFLALFPATQEHISRFVIRKYGLPKFKTLQQFCSRVTTSLCGIHQYRLLARKNLKPAMECVAALRADQLQLLQTDELHNVLFSTLYGLPKLSEITIDS
jgi:hypothetical protein